MPLILLLLLGLAACTLPQRQEACALDRAGQPIIIPLEGVASALEPVVALPLGLAHAGAQVGCAVVLTEVP
jgi:hypothetical protein